MPAMLSPENKTAVGKPRLRVFNPLMLIRAAIFVYE